MKIESLWSPEQREYTVGKLPDLELVENLSHHTTSLILPGRIYNTKKVHLPTGEVFAVKDLKPEIVGEGGLQLYIGLELAEVFSKTIQDHEVFTDTMPEFVLPTCFYLVERDGQIFYKTIQPWIVGIQFKDAVRNNIEVPNWQMPDILSRVRFLQRLAAIHRDSRIAGKIQDLDFFIEDKVSISRIRVQDTNYFWHPKLPIDLSVLTTNLPNFLFSESEREIDIVRNSRAELEASLPNLW